MTASTPNLFEREPAVPGPARFRDLLTLREEATLIRHFAEVELPRFQFQRWTSNRRTATFGWKYDLTNSSFAVAEPIPDFLLPLRAAASALIAIDPASLVQALIIRYDPGAGIGWHKDRPEFGDILGVSLGAPTLMRFRRRRPSGGFDRLSVELPSRSLYHLVGEIRDEWEHSIAPMNELRWSVTFRNLSPLGGRRGAEAAHGSSYRG